jgi:hypothetical protein
MRLVAIIASLYIGIAMGPAQALTMGEVGTSAVALVKTKCGDAFARHQSHWPNDDATRDVIWRNDEILTSDQEITGENAGLNERLHELTAWQMSGYALVDDLVLVSTFAARADPPPPEWLERYSLMAESLVAAADIYDCARPSDAEFAEVVDLGASEELFQTVAVWDCMSRLGRQMAGAFVPGEEAETVHEAIAPLVAEIEGCSGSGSE